MLLLGPFGTSVESTKSAIKAFKAKRHGGCTASHMRGVVSKALEGNDVGSPRTGCQAPAKASGGLGFRGLGFRGRLAEAE